METSSSINEMFIPTIERENDKVLKRSGSVIPVIEWQPDIKS